jgi:hypothetical protein
MNESVHKKNQKKKLALKNYEQHHEDFQELHAATSITCCHQILALTCSLLLYLPGAVQKNNGLWNFADTGILDEGDCKVRIHSHTYFAFHSEYIVHK